MLAHLKNSRSFLRFLKNTNRNLNTSSKVRGGGGHAAPSANHQTNEKSGGLINIVKSWIVVPEHPKAHQGYFYRELANLQGSNAATLGQIALGLAWYWVFYNLWADPESFFGHMSYPDTSKWTNAELGIPADDEE